jgi:hypothetical protein
MAEAAISATPGRVDKDIANPVQLGRDLVPESGSRDAPRPSAICKSEWQTPQAITRTMMPPSGSGIGRSCNSSGVPNDRNTTARMRQQILNRQSPRRALLVAREAIQLVELSVSTDWNWVEGAARPVATLCSA